MRGLSSPTVLPAIKEYRDYRPLAILVSHPDTGEVIGGLVGRTSFGLLFVERFSLPEKFRIGLGSRVVALAEEEPQRRAAPAPPCSR